MLNNNDLKESYSAFMINNLDRFLPYTVITAFQAVGGLIGNILIIGSILSTKRLQTKTNALILNLALSDLLISIFVDTFNVIGAIAGEEFFEPLQKFCTILAVICMVCCVGSAMGVALLAFNRFLFILYPHHYVRIFTKANTIAFCMMTWITGLVYYLPAFYDPIYSIFDLKTLNCIWNRKASRCYTIVSLSIIMFLPSVSITFFYSRIFFKKLESDRNIQSHHLNEHPNRKLATTSSPRSSHSDSMNKTIKTTKGLLLACVFFLITHLPYAITVLIDVNDEFPGKLYMYAATTWHLNSALNCILYAFTNTQLKEGYINFLSLIFDRKSYSYTKVL